MILRRLDAAEAEALLPRFVDLMVEAVEHGASIGYHPPMPRDEAERFWRGILDGVRRGDRVLLAALGDEGELLGTGQLLLESRPNGRHRGEVQKVMVAVGARRRGIARAIMEALEGHAREAGRRLLVLDTREGDPAAQLYRSMGWQLTGPIPDYVLEHDGSLSATLVFHKRLPAG